MLPRFTYPFPPREHILWQFLDTSLSAISLFQDSAPRSSCQNAMETWNSVFEKSCLPQRGRNKNSVKKFTPVHPVFSIIGRQDRQQHYTVTRCELVNMVNYFLPGWQRSTREPAINCYFAAAKVKLVTEESASPTKTVKLSPSFLRDYGSIVHQEVRPCLFIFMLRIKGASNR